MSRRRRRHVSEREADNAMLALILLACYGIFRAVLDVARLVAGLLP